MTNIAIQNTFMVMKLEAYEPDNSFTDEQRKELSGLIEAVEGLEIGLNNVRSIPKNLRLMEDAIKAYDLKFRKYGGNVKRLEEKLTEARDMSRASLPGYIQGKTVFDKLKLAIRRKEK